MKYYLNRNQFYKLAFQAESFNNDRGLGKTFPHLDIEIFLKSKYNLNYIKTSNTTIEETIYGHIEFNSDKDLTLFLLQL